MKGPNRASRRQFMRGAMATAAAMACGLDVHRSTAFAGTSPRRHLINVVRWGGWDSLWFHNAVDIAQYRDVIDPVQSICDGSGFFKSKSGNILEPYASEYTNLPTGLWHTRFADSFLGRHPSGEPMGPGLSFYNASDYNNILIWRGIEATSGGHFIGNQIIQSGALGEYASFSAIVAANEIMLGNAKDLHYVQISNTAQELYTTLGDLGSTLSPVNVANQNAWLTATTMPTGGPSPKTSAAIDRAIASVANMVVNGKKTRDETKSIYRSFISGFQASARLGVSNYAQSAEFQSLVAAYSSEITSIAQNHVFNTWFLKADMTAHIAELSFRFALAEFLVSKNLSAVVDLLVPGPGDFHDAVDSECMYMLCTHAAYLTLIRRLKQKESAPGSGVSMLDITTTIMHTEFDRSPLLQVGNPAFVARPGTAHWPQSTSVIMAGYGVAAGKILGDFKRGSGSAAKYGTSDYSKFKPYYPLPIDARSGAAKPDGVIPTIRSINPVVVNIFGAGGLSHLNIGDPLITAALKR